MRRSESARNDRFFANHWECRCGRTAILDTPQPTTGHKGAVGAQDKGFEPSGLVDLRLGGTRTETSREDRAIVCGRCGESMRPINIPDRFFADYWECGGCGRAAPLHRLLADTDQERAIDQENSKPWSDGPKRPAPNSGIYRKDPNFAEVQTVSDAVAHEPPEEPVVGKGCIPLPQLWGQNYLVTVESRDFLACLGLPQTWEATEIRAGAEIYRCAAPDFPAGFHMALSQGSSLAEALPRVRSAVVWLYEELLVVSRDLGEGGVRRHLLAPVAALCRLVPLKTGLDSTPFQLLLAQDHSFPYEILYLQRFLQELLDRPMIPTTGRLLSLRALGTKPGVLAIEDLKLEDDEIETLKQFFGPYRFAD